MQSRFFGLVPCLLLLALAGGARAGAPLTPDQVKGPDTWGGLEGVAHLGHLSLAGQPDRAALAAAREAGVVGVINLRDPSELADLGFDERAEVEALGMAYHSVPVTRPDLYDEATFAAIEAALAEHGEGHVLVHCASGGRVSGWLALHLERKHAMSLDDALAVSRRTGMSSPMIERAVRDAQR